MKLDKATLDMILKLPDDQLILIIQKLAREKGINISNLNITREQLSTLRKSLSGATDADIARATEILGGYGKK